MSKTVKVLLSAGFLLGLLGVLGVLGLATGAPAFAQDTTPPTSVPQSLPGRGFGLHLGCGFGGSWSTFDAAADALGLTPVQLFSELHSGKTLEEIAEAQGVDLEKVQEAMQAARVQAMKEAIQKAVEEGQIPQDQADWMLEGLEKGFFPMGRGFGRGHWRNGPSNPNGATPFTSPSSTS